MNKHGQTHSKPLRINDWTSILSGGEFSASTHSAGTEYIKQNTVKYNTITIKLLTKKHNKHSQELPKQSK